MCDGKCICYTNLCTSLGVTFCGVSPPPGDSENRPCTAARSQTATSPLHHSLSLENCGTRNIPELGHVLISYKGVDCRHLS